ncbi:hypothetical protein BJI67_12820 [Acidihalobacter aeolianus]|uniref:Uncharacterized protein n=1 Tax=Acidihalobacter aeolianus TaxID=2792603 RepID=A0A1D8KA43_9GAMM|nr:hypothetical protein BJI67_12820 [Acidihalobacter aeolianus]
MLRIRSICLIDTDPQHSPQIHATPIIQQEQMRKQPPCWVWLRIIHYAEKLVGLPTGGDGRDRCVQMRFQKVHPAADRGAKPRNLTFVFKRRPKRFVTIICFAAIFVARATHLSTVANQNSLDNV